MAITTIKNFAVLEIMVCLKRYVESGLTWCTHNKKHFVKIRKAHFQKSGGANVLVGGNLSNRK